MILFIGTLRHGRHYGSHPSVPVSLISNDMINTEYALFRPIGLLVTSKAV